MTHKRRQRLSLKTVYYTSFLTLVVVPILIVLILSLTVLNQVFRRQAVENIERAQEAVASELRSDMEQISMRLSHMAYANDSELLSIAAAADTGDPDRRYKYQQQLNEAAGYATEPVKDIVSVAFYMKDGSRLFYKNDILLPNQVVRSEDWYREAVAAPNRVVIGSYNTNHTELYSSGAGDSFVLTAALSPDVSLDRSQKIEMISFFQVTGADHKMKAYNQAYRQGKNKIGYTRIVDGRGNSVYEPAGIPQGEMEPEGRTRVITPLSVYGNRWYVESYIPTAELTADYWAVAGLLLLALTVVLTLFAVFSRYFLKRIIQPVQQVSRGLKLVEEGELEVHLTPEGQYEVRTMIHSFNAMVRRLKALIEDYQQRVRQGEKSMADHLAALIRGEMSPEEVCSQAPEFFGESYLLMAVTAEKGEGQARSQVPFGKDLLPGFDTIPRFASRCTASPLASNRFLVLYRVKEENYEGILWDLIRQMRCLGKEKMKVDLSFCIGRVRRDGSCFPGELMELSGLWDLYVLCGSEGVLDLNRNFDAWRRIGEMAGEWSRLAAGLYIADEKTVSQEKEGLLLALRSREFEEARWTLLAAVLATARQFAGAGEDFSHIFGEKINYFEKIGRIDDLRRLRLWVANYCSWVAEYSRSRLDVARADPVTRAKHYVMEHYQNPGLTLGEVAEYVDLSEKYFTTKFTKECGETFLSYLTGLRIQKAKELIRGTTFKMYEIGEMVGYNNPEHFNRTFRRQVGISPAQFRKSQGDEGGESGNSYL